MYLHNRIFLPVQWVILHAEVVPGEVASWVAQVVELVPQQSLVARGGGDDGHFERNVDLRLPGLTP